MTADVPGEPFIWEVYAHVLVGKKHTHRETQEEHEFSHAPYDFCETRAFS